MIRSTSSQSEQPVPPTPHTGVQDTGGRPFVPIPGGTFEPWRPVRFDPSLIRKYDRPGPRYTSYPTAPHFSTTFGRCQYSNLLAASVHGAKPLSLYVHIPFCKTLCFYCGCNVTVSRSRHRGDAYLPLLEREMALTSELAAGSQRQVVQIHWGGGTPTFLPPEDLARLMGMIRRSFALAPDCEIGVEVDPRQCTPQHLDVLAEIGVNRLSLGVQDLDPQVQQAVNRIQPAALTWEVLDGARQRGISSINLDLIYGLPYQTTESFSHTLREVVAMAPDRLAVFNFAYLPTMLPHHRVLDVSQLPGVQTRLRLLEETIRRLTAAGYVFIGMDHFAKPGDPLTRALEDGTLRRNFQGYTTCGETDLLAFGNSSISSVANGYAQNHKELSDYTTAIEEGHLATCRGYELEPEDLLRRDVISRLMCHFRLVKAEVEERHHIAFDQHFRRELAALAPLGEDGLLELRADSLEVTPRGRVLVRNIAMAFDAYLEGPNPTSYSRTV